MTALWFLKDTPFEESSEDGICWVQKPIEICPRYLAWKPKNKYHEKIYNAVWGSMNIKSATFRHCSDWLLSEVGDKLAYCDKSIYKCNKNNVWEIVDNGDGDLLGKLYLSIYFLTLKKNKLGLRRNCLTKMTQRINILLKNGILLSII